MIQLERAMRQGLRALVWINLVLWSTASKAWLLLVFVLVAGVGETVTWHARRRLEREFIRELEQHRARPS